MVETNIKGAREYTDKQYVATHTTILRFEQV